ncbi:MAG: hypothetical protein Q8L35_08680 [Actinomycetota bacterium]|nr:hypothetical protein [Actinomycetota bacterium]
MKVDANLIIGIDFDNTLITYDDIFYELAVSGGLVPVATDKNKKLIRDRIRRLPDGDIEWQKLQAIAYGALIGEAKLIEGVKSFFLRCRQHGAKVNIISHKTEFAGYDETKTNLRVAALEWMAANGFFESSGLGLTREEVFFNSSRSEKIECIKQLGCTYFIDDLEETFLDDAFPPEVKKIHFTSGGKSAGPSGALRLSDWGRIGDYLFGPAVIAE